MMDERYTIKICGNGGSTAPIQVPITATLGQVIGMRENLAFPLQIIIDDTCTIKIQSPDSKTITVSSNSNNFEQTQEISLNLNQAINDILFQPFEIAEDIANNIDNNDQTFNLVDTGGLPYDIVQNNIHNQNNNTSNSFVGMGLEDSQLNNQNTNNKNLFNAEYIDNFTINNNIENNNNQNNNIGQNDLQLFPNNNTANNDNINNQNLPTEQPAAMDFETYNGGQANFQNLVKANIEQKKQHNANQGDETHYTLNQKNYILNLGRTACEELKQDITNKPNTNPYLQQLNNEVQQEREIVMTTTQYDINNIQAAPKAIKHLFDTICNVTDCAHLIISASLMPNSDDIYLFIYDNEVNIGDFKINQFQDKRLEPQNQPPELKIPFEPDIQYVEEPQIEYVEQPQIEYVEQPQIEYVEEPQVVQYVEQANHQEPVVGGESGYTYFTQPQRLKRIGGTMQGITNTPFVPVQKIQRHYYQHQQIQQPPMQQPPQEGVAKPIPITSTITIEEEKPEEIDITVGKAPKKVVKKKKRKTAKSEKSGDFYNIRTDIKESGGVAAQAGQPGAPVAPVSTNPQVATTTSPQSPLVIVTDTQKKEQLKTDDNVKVILDHTPVNAKDDIKMTIDHKDIVDELKVLIEQKGQEQAKTMKDIVDNIKVTIENNQDIPKEQLQLYDKILIEIDKIAQKTPEISFDFNNDDVLKEIDSLKEKIDNLERGDIVVRDDISIDLNQLEEVNGRLASIESRLDAMKTPSEAAKSIDELKIEIQDLKEKYPEFVVDYPDVQQITDKLSLLIEEKFKDLKINDKIEVSQQVPEISIDLPQFNVNDRIEVQNGEKPRDMIVNDKVDIKNPDIVIEQPEIVVEQQDLSGITNSIEELKKTFGNFKDEIKIQIEQKLKDINVNDKIEVNQQVPEISIDFPNFNVNGKTEVNQNAPAKKEDNETVITNEYIENGTKAEDTEIVNEYEEKREPIVQGSAPSPMPGFIPHQMMMPPVFMPPPMPMPVAGLAAQQPIVITQNQSDEEKGNSFWSNFWKVLLILLLIASIIGLGLLMWKNMQKNTEQKQEPKPDQPEPKPEPQPQKQEEIKITPNDPVNPGAVKTSEGQTVQPVCEDGQNLQLNVNADKVNLGTDVGQLTTDAKSAINLENVGTHNKLIGENGNTIDTSHIIIDNNKIQVREWGDITKNPKVYEGTIQNGKAVINGQTYTIANENGNAYSSGSIDLAKQTSYTRNSDGTLSTNFGDLKSDMQINKNNTFTLNTKTENGTVVSTNTVDDISNNATMQDILKNKLNDSSLTKGEYNRIMDALDNGKLDDSYFQTINNNKTGLSLDNGNGVGNSTGV